MKKIVITLAIVFMVSLTAAASTVPPLINYQGLLTDANGNPMTGTKQLEFNLYDAATGGAIVWGPQIFNSIPLINGKFNVILGTTDTTGRSIAEAFSAKDRYLGIKVNNGTELAPRQQILSAPYAVQSEYAAEAAHAVEANHAIEADHAAEADHAIEADLATAVRGLPPADYDSGWFYVDRNKIYDKSHGLDALPRLAIIWGAIDAEGNDMYMMDGVIHKYSDNVKGSWLKGITTTDYIIRTGTDSSMVLSHVFSSKTGFIRVFMWK